MKFADYEYARLLTKYFTINIFAPVRIPSVWFVPGNCILFSRNNLFQQLFLHLSKFPSHTHILPISFPLILTSNN